MKYLLITGLVFLVMILPVGKSFAAVTVYTDETAFLNALGTQLPVGYDLVAEGFENEAVWGGTRDPAAASSVVSQGITWSSRHINATSQTGQITTGPGPAYTGFWGAWSEPHGDPDRNLDPDVCDVTPPPVACLTHDGLLADTLPSTTLYGVGVWFQGTFNSRVNVILNGNNVSPIDFGDGGVYTSVFHQFVGFIETNGFDSFEFLETEGKTGDEKFVFFDDFTIAGTFPSQPGILVAPLSIDFGKVTVGSSQEAQVAVSNNGTANLTIGTIAASDPLTTPFSLVAGQDNCSGQILAPVASCTVTVRFGPGALGIVNDSFDIPSDDPNAPSVTVNLSGDGESVPTPNISLSTTSIGFGDVMVGSLSDQTVTVLNLGNAVLTVGDIAVSNPLALPFEIVAGQDNCSRQIVPAAAGCTFVVRFSPQVDGVINDSFDVPSDDPDTPSITVFVSGNGTPVPIPDITVSTTSINFGDVMVGNSSDQQITVSNNGNASLAIGALGSIDPLTAPFELVAGMDNCSNQSLLPVASCSVTVRYSPTALGILNDSFDIPSDDPDTASITVSVNGNGIPVPTPDIAVSTTSISFGDVMVGNSSDQLVTVSNNGNANLAIGMIASLNPLLAPFEVVVGLDNCSNQSLLPSSSCSVAVRYAPEAIGLLNESFDIPSDDPDTPSITVSVNGNGTPVPTPNIGVTPNTINFGDIIVGNQSEQMVTVSNSGNANLNIGTLASIDPLAAPFAIVAGQDNCSNQSLLPSTSCTVTVRYGPIVIGIVNDSFDIPSDDSDTPSIIVNLSGNGLPAVVNNPPAMPTLVYPANGQIDLPTTLTFRWEESVDPEGAPVSYQLLYCEDSSFFTCLPNEVFTMRSLSGHFLTAGLGGALLTGFILAGHFSKRKKLILLVVILLAGQFIIISCGGGGGGGSSSSETTPPVGGVSFTATGLTANTTYYWKVVASDGQETSESAPRSFSTQ